MKPSPSEILAGGDIVQIRNQTPEFFYTSEDTNFQRISEIEVTNERAEVGWHEFVSSEGEFSTVLESRLPSDVLTSLRALIVESKPSEDEIDFQEILRLRDELPIIPLEQEIVDAAREHPVTIVVAETGGGKSTQLPQMAYRAAIRPIISHTSPRRAATRNIHEQVSKQMAAEYGKDVARTLVSYQTAGDRSGPIDAPVTMCTDGLELVKDASLKNDLERFSDMLVVVDEVHEWNTNIEVQLAYYKHVIRHNPDFRIIISSATVDADRLVRYFADVCDGTVPVIEVPGRMYPVEKREEPKSTVVNEALKAVWTELEPIEDGKVLDDKAHDILVFQAGIREIEDTIDEIYARLTPEQMKQVVVLPLYAKLSVREEQAALSRYPGKIKIVVSTNVAETSLTIPGIKYVIDSGEHRRMEIDRNGTQGLMKRPISQAECDQRAGRAGRVCEGIYILTRANIESEFVQYIKREKFPIPEILRTDIVRHTLRIAAMGLDIKELELPSFVGKEKDADIMINRAKETLRLLGAFDENNKITKLGERMDQLPVRPSLSRMLIEASRYSETTRAYAAAIAAAVEVGGIPYFAYNVERRWEELTEEKTSDLLAALDLFIAIQGADTRFMRDHDIDIQNVDRARELYGKLVRRTKASTEILLPPSQEERDDLRHCIVSGHVTNVYRQTDDGNYLHVRTDDEIRTISPRSVVTGNPSLVIGDAYRIERKKNGKEPEIQHILERVTVTTVASLAIAAAHLTEWQPAGLIMRSGKFVQQRRLTLFGTGLGIFEEVSATPSKPLRKAVISHALSNPGSAQIELRTIKKTLEELAHISKDPVNQLTHDTIIELVDQAAPADITDPSLLDMNLRAIMVAQAITLDSFVSPERRERIEKDAPKFFSVGDVTLKLKYQKGKPLAHHFRKDDILALPDEDLFLNDGRQIVFLYRDNQNKTKRVGIHELKDKLRQIEDA